MNLNMKLILLIGFLACLSTFIQGIPSSMDEQLIDDDDEIAEYIESDSSGGQSVAEKIDKLNEVGKAPKCLKEGDIMPPHCSDNNDAEKRNAVRDRSKLWHTREIPYCLHSSLSDQKKRKIREAIEDFHKYTCLRFTSVACDYEKHFIKISSAKGCWSYVGKTNGAFQRLSIGDGCGRKGIVIHELMHALGFWHEQSRYDRDKFVKIVWKNIKRSKKSNFKIHPVEESTTLGLPYDYDGIMHYGPKAFAINRRKPTIIPKKGNPEQLGQRAGFSHTDLAQLNALYNCERSNTRGWSEWSHWSTCFSVRNVNRERSQRFCLNSNLGRCNGKRVDKRSRRCGTVSQSLWRKTICEGGVAKLKCPRRYEIHLHSINYGRTTKYHCNGIGRSTNRINCRSRKSPCIVNAKCQYRRTCSVPATNEVFGDPCCGTYKYLDISYWCRRRTSKHVKVFCENSVVALSCPRCKKLHILNASYGRTNTSSCRRGSTRRTNCAACGSKCKVKKYCHGKRSCRFSASNHVFGDPCRGTYKYLRVTFKCVASRC